MRRLGLWMALSCMLLGLAAPAWAAPGVEISVQVTNGGRVKHGGWATLLVELVNQGAELSGELVVEEVGVWPHAQYVVPVTLPSGGAKQVPVSLEVNGGHPLAVKLYSDGKLLAEEKLSLTYLSPEVVMIGVLSEDGLTAPALGQLQPFQGRPAQAVHLSDATFPDQTRLLEDLDLILLSRFDSSSLSPDQLRALEVWVERGGTLLLAGGPEWRGTLEPLPPSLVPVEVTGLREVALDPLGEVAGRPLSGSGMVTEGRLVRGQGLVYSGEVPLVVSAPVGSGRVLYLAFDPGLSPVVGWTGQEAFYSRLLGSSGTAPWGWPQEQTWMLMEALRRIPDWSLPSIWIVALLLGSYLLLIGPANYLLLKRLDRREWGWFTIPALSILFLGLVYLVGFGRFQPLMSHLITVTELSPETGAATVSSHVGIYSPSQRQLRIPLENGGLVRPLWRGSAAEGQINARVTMSGDQRTVELLGLNNYSMSGFSVEQDREIPGGLKLVDTKLEESFLSFRVKNELAVAVDGLYVSVGNSSRWIGRLEPGQTSEAHALDLGLVGSVDPKRGFGQSIAVPQETGEDHPRRSMIRQYVYERLSSRPGPAVVISGWTDQPLAPLKLPDLGKLTQGANLVYSMLPLPTAGDLGEIPPGVVLGRPSDPKGVDWLPHGYMLHPGSRSFTLLLPPLDPSKVGAVELHFGLLGNPQQVRTAVKNQKSGEWLMLSGERAPLPNWEEYISPMGLMEIRYDVAEYMEILPPTVAVKGGSR